jgi:hypothetical protein
MYQISIEKKDGLIKLVEMMAAEVAAEFTVRTVIKTRSSRLARAVSALVDEPMIVDPELDATTGLGWGLLGQIQAEDGPAEGIDLDELRADLGLKSEVNQEKPAGGLGEPVNGKVNGKPAKNYGPCEFCDQPRLPRSKTCGSEECDKKLNHKHQAAYQARKEAKAAQAAPASAEAAKSENPLSLGTAPKYQVDGLENPITFDNLVTLNKTGAIPDGTRCLAQPSGRWYVVRGGHLKKESQDVTAAGR